MKIRYLAVGMIVLMATSAMVWAEETGGSGGGNAGTKITESIIYTEGVDLAGLPVVESSDFPAATIGSAENIEIDWSDNLIYTQFAAGSMVRVEATFHNIEVLEKKEDPDPAVYAVRTHLKIEKIDDIGGEVTDTVWEGSIRESLELPDNERMFYSEINQVGHLIYGFNWDTRTPDMKAEPGWYRITFWFEEDEFCPEDPYKLQLTWHADADHDSPLEEGVDFLINEDHLNDNWCSIDIELLEKELGGRHET
ncbi:MAG: hypothetical protein E4G94_08280 [ANME-2 cluster archaeon]|nr:MAG: hypothetical protein E4G94_08280 [ANME-2 cluster archaeon]